MIENNSNSTGDISRIRVVTASKPGTPGLSYALARSDEEEAALHAAGKAQGFVTMAGKPLEPCPEVNGVLDYIRRARRAP